MTPEAGQPRDRRGTVGHPYSALNLRLLFAAFGLLFTGVLAVLLARADQPVLAVLAAVFAAIAAADLVVIARRLRQRRRANPHHPHSLFE